MDGNTSKAPPPLPRNDRAGLRRVAAAIAVSTLLHLGIALWMRPDYRPVNDFAVDFEITHMTDVPKRPAPPQPEPPPEPIPEPKAETPQPKKKLPKTATSDPAPLLPPPEISTDEPVSTAAAADTDSDAFGAGGICMHDLFAYAAGEPTWILYIAAAAFRDSVYEKPLADTLNSFELGRRLSKTTGMNLTRDVESLFVGASDIFDWKSFQIATSYDFGEEELMARIKAQQKNHAEVTWAKTDDGYTASIPGQFRWQLVSSGRVMSITHEPEAKAVIPQIPDNPFAAGTDADTNPEDAEGTDRSTEAQAAAFPKQVACISQENPSLDKKRNRQKENALADLARQLAAPDKEGHWPVALLSTSDPRAVGLGTRLGRRMGFETAVVRGYFTEPVRIEGYLRFSKDPAVVEALAADWRKDAQRFAADPFLAVAGVASLLKNLTISTDGPELHFSLQMNHGQVLSTLLFLQLQGKALERQLLSD